MMDEPAPVERDVVDAAAPRPHVSTYAILSLMCSLAVFCPVTTIVGPLLGLRALVQIKADPRVAGRRLALAGIIIGVFATAAWVGGGYWWHVNARVKMLGGPERELRAGLAGDIAAFKSGFTNEGAAAPDEEARSFLNDLSQRYGALISSRLDRDAAQDKDTVPQGSYRLTYQMRFERGAAHAQARFVVTADGRPPWVLKFGWVRIIDPARGDLVYPASMHSEATQGK